MIRGVHPCDDPVIAQEVREGTRQKIIEERMDGFISRSANRLFHVRPHGRNARDTISYKGKEHLKKGFWFNDDSLKSIISDNLRE